MHDFCLTIPYGMVVMIGGVIGFLVAGSKISLMAGGGSGGLLMLLGYGGYMEYKSRGTVSQLWTVASLVVANVLWVVMGKRIQKTGKLMPSAPVALLSVGMAIFYVSQMMKAASKPSSSASSSSTTVGKKDS